MKRANVEKGLRNKAGKGSRETILEFYAGSSEIFILFMKHPGAYLCWQEKPSWEGEMGDAEEKGNNAEREIFVQVKGIWPGIDDYL